MNYKPYFNLSDEVAKRRDIIADNLQRDLCEVRPHPQTDIIVAEEVEE